jgi:hypothetical protein
MSTDTTHWPLLEERAPYATAAPRGHSRRRLPRSAWILAGLAFVCGGLVSAAALSIGWRHQAQRDTAARTALAAATARTHRLELQRSALRSSLESARQATAAAVASEHALATTGAKVAADATESSGAAGSVSSGSGSLTAAASRIASELKTLDTYLTTTPANQLDPGYISSQAAYLAQQLTRLQTDAGNLGSSVASFEVAIHKLTRDAQALKRN